MARPDYAPGQKHVVDLAAVTGIELDFARLPALQARKADAVMPGGAQTVIVYHAPTAMSRRMAEMVRRSWADVPSAVPVVGETEAEALRVPGEPETCFADLLQAV